MFRYSVNARASVPRHCVGAFGPAKLTSGNAESASPAGRPRRPACNGYLPSIVAFSIGTDSRANPALIWFTHRELITDVCLICNVVGTSSTSRVSANGSGSA
ncbi:MAG: hypothetical protein DMF97_19265, partial [Acidobacteria bacterium]